MDMAHGITVIHRAERGRGTQRATDRVRQAGEPERRAHDAANDCRDAPIWRYDENCLLE
ncbi:hypothetical protein FEP95_04248 [Burkholderia multivorans]|nr:hypothetical protein NP80_1989 [Burkholderia multivorans ATCC BAA-247]MDR8747966.1 hypothetical protein [Burkholderia multivorans]MDR8809169.1 hypothetical protein [Burkholderia multivorans]SAK08381.1 hypothetical protein UA14_01250 [Burkholderia multivorans]SAK16029.1 hypothetical protein UA21_01362 [Burkholderia multivorans]